MSDHTEELWMICAMPKESYEQLDAEGLMIRDLTLYDAALRNHYKENIEWQESDEQLKYAKEAKKAIEYKIAHELKFKK